MRVRQQGPQRQTKLGLSSEVAEQKKCAESKKQETILGMSWLDNVEDGFESQKLLAFLNAGNERRGWILPTLPPLVESLSGPCIPLEGSIHHL